MIIHKEGYKTIGIAAFLFGIINLLSFTFLSGPIPWLAVIIFFFTLAVLIFLILFFRSPAREFEVNESKIVSPADGKIVVIEEITEQEYFKDKRMQVSIFMSPADVHLNRSPVDGVVTYSQYSRGKYWVAWHPKSSLENERHSVVIKNKNGELMIKQIAGAMARRIMYDKINSNNIKQQMKLFIKKTSHTTIQMVLRVKANQNDQESRRDRV